MQQANNVIPIDIKWSSAIIMRFKTMYGARFDQQWSGIDPELLAKQWSEDLAGLTGDEIKTGLTACKSKDWPPTIPEFLKMCRPYLEPEIAFHAAVKGLTARSQGKHGEWTHPAIFWTAVKIGTHDMQNVTFHHLKNRWTAALTETLADGRWEPIPEVLVELHSPKPNPEKVKQAISPIISGGIKPIDTREWARKIIKRVEKNEKVPPTIHEMAQRALGLI